jgi:very-short-patch-repair endonuclease/predicted transcriptional regulator of viral defense system
MALDVATVVGPTGWATWDELTARVDRATVARWVGTGRLVRLQPEVYALPAVTGDWRVRLAAAVRVCGGVVSHRSALALWGVGPAVGPVHLTVDHRRSGRGTPGVVLHRTRELTPSIRRVDGLPVTCVERAVVDTWGSAGAAHRPEARAAAIDAVRRRLCAPRDLLHEIERRPCLPGRAELVRLVGLLADGCQSELEIRGCLEVLRAPGMPPFTQQRRVTVAGETFVLDAAYDEVLLAVEMDGAAFHGSRDQRERDIRRDALVATIGWQTMRFAQRRLTREPDACRREIRAVHETRSRLFGVGRVR